MRNFLFIRVLKSIIQISVKLLALELKKGLKWPSVEWNVLITSDVIKILGIYFSYNKKLEQEKNFFNHIVKIQNILKLWKLRKLSIERRIVAFKSLAISKLTHLALVPEIPTSTINLLTKTQMEFIWKGKTPNVKSSTLCNDYDNGGLKMLFFQKL